MTFMDNTTDSPAKPSVGDMAQDGNFGLLITPEI